MSEIFDQCAYNAGAEEAKRLTEQIKGYINSLPAGFRVEIRADQLYIFAPHNLYVNPGNWNYGYDNSGQRFSYIWLSQLTEENWNKFMTAIKEEIAKVERSEGFRQKLKDEFAPLQKQDEKPPEPPKPPEPEKPKLSDQERRLRGLETDIAEHIKAAEIAKELGLTPQVEEHEAELKHLRRVAEAIKRGFEEIDWDNDKYESLVLDKYRPLIPVHVLESLKSAKQSELFDSFGIWDEKEDPDPVLISRIETGTRKTQFRIDGW